MVNGPTYRALTVPYAYSRLRLWRNTPIASMAPGATATITAGCSCILGHEFDEDLDNGFRPAGTDQAVRDHDQRLTVVAGLRLDLRQRHRDPQPDAVPGEQRRAGVRRGHGQLVVGPGRAPRHADLGARHQYSAGHGQHPGRYGTRSRVTLQAGLVAAIGLDRHDALRRRPSPRPPRAPTCRAARRSRSAAPPRTVGGQVGGVEVSVDGGTTWHPATGTTSWSYTWTPSAPGHDHHPSRAPPTTAATSKRPRPVVMRRSTPRVCPCTLVPSAVPTHPGQ